MNQSTEEWRREMREIQRDTAERLNALIATVDRIIRNRDLS